MAIIDYLKDRRILALIAVVVLLGACDYVYGLHLGIEFAGGTQIPITLQQAVNANQTSQIISILQQRLSTFGLKQVSIEGVGDSEILVEIPSNSTSDIQSTIALIESQGVFQGIINGRLAVDGSSILSGSVGATTPVVEGDNVTWAVDFYITPQAATQFSKIAFGQANKPIYLFLDRPTDAIVLINSTLVSGGAAGPEQNVALGLVQSAVQFGNATIPIEILNPNSNNWPALYKFFQANRDKYNQVILANNTPQFIINNLTAINYTIDSKSVANMTPAFVSYNNGTGAVTLLDSWSAIGLLSAPTLAAGITNGNASQSYTISGSAPSTLSLVQQEAYATTQSTLIKSVLTGGALPVRVIVGQPTITPATLGVSFEKISVVALIAAVIAVSIVIAIRYRKLFLIAPILLTTMAELFIILSIIGLLGTIDLAAVAGMIAVVGTGVDAQIIISDEALHATSDSTMKIRLNNAFYIVWADAFLLIVAMLPLFFSTSLVTVIGFSESTIIGAMLGAFVTRPSYGAILSRHYAGGEHA